MLETSPSYPIGRFETPAIIDDVSRAGFIRDIELMPARLRASVDGLDDARLDTPYRDGGWTVRQVVHHVPDSHMNAYVRMKLALTEEEPLIKTYEEARWAELPEACKAPVELSLSLLESLHARWVACIRSLSPDRFGRTLRHPEIGLLRIDTLLALYAWHGRHHVAHITRLRERKGWGSFHE